MDANRCVKRVEALIRSELAHFGINKAGRFENKAVVCMRQFRPPSPANAQLRQANWFLNNE